MVMAVVFETDYPIPMGNGIRPPRPSYDLVHDRAHNSGARRSGRGGCGGAEGGRRVKNVGTVRDGTDRFVELDAAT